MVCLVALDDVQQTRGRIRAAKRRYSHLYKRFFLLWEGGDSSQVKSGGKARPYKILVEEITSSQQGESTIENCSRGKTAIISTGSRVEIKGISFLESPSGNFLGRRQKR